MGESEKSTYPLVLKRWCDDESIQFHITETFENSKNLLEMLILIRLHQVQFLLIFPYDSLHLWNNWCPNQDSQGLQDILSFEFQIESSCQRNFHFKVLLTQRKANVYHRLGHFKTNYCLQFGSFGIRNLLEIDFGPFQVSLNFNEAWQPHWPFNLITT